jgi:hypothetical protein
MRQFNQALIEEGKDWADAELHALALERGVKFHHLTWSESLPAQVWIIEIKSGAGEHTLSLTYDTLEKCAREEAARAALRERLRGLVGDLARIERRGHLR